MLTRAEARRIALAIAGAEEGSHFGKPAIFLHGKFLARVHDKEEAVVVVTDSLEMRDVMLEAEPRLFYITEHYRKYPALLARLKALDRKTLRDLLAARAMRIGAKPARRAAAKAPARQAAGKKGAGKRPAPKSAAKRARKKRAG